MTLTRLRDFALTLPHAAETFQWGDKIVLWAAPRDLGGKIFAILALDAVPDTPRHPLAAFAAGPTRMPDLLERDGFLPAPHLARAHWVAVTRWDALSPREWQAELTAAHAYVFHRLPARVRARLQAGPATP